MKEIVIFVAGATPQIITETVCALAMKTPPVYANELYIVTTLTGRRLILETLVEQGMLKRLVDEYGLPPLELKPESFVLIRDEQGAEVEDIRNASENEAAGDIISSLIQRMTEDPETRLHCSIAGGRKTMSFYMGSALQLFGRPWDKLYHVLVTPEFESNPSFFYKPKKNIVIECRQPDGTMKKLRTKDAEICLAELPFIRLRNKVSLRGKSFRELVAEGQKNIDTAAIQPEIRLKLQERTIYIGDTLIELVPVQMMLYAAFLKQKTERCKYTDRTYCFECKDCFQPLTDFTSRPFLEAAAKDYSAIYGLQPFKAAELLNKWRDGMSMETVRQHISKINRAIKEQLDDAVLLPYFMISAIKQYGGSRYGVVVDKSRIKIQNA